MRRPNISYNLLLQITIPFGQANEFAISSPGGEYLLKAVETGV